MADTLTIDFETYYDKEYSLRKLTPAEYIQDERYQTIGVAVKRNDEPTEWCTDDELGIKEFLNQYDWENSIVIAHNAYFDGAILEWRYGIKPMQYFCTMLAARAVARPFTERGSVSLAKVSDYYQIGAKGSEVMNAIALRREDMIHAGNFLNEYAAYCKKDVNLTYALYQLMEPDLPKDEQDLIHLTIRKFTRPQLKIDKDICVHRLAEHKLEKEALLAKCGITDPSVLRSANKFADILLAVGVSPPKKISPRTGKETYAFAKTDHGMKQLLEHDDPLVRALAEARVGHSTSIEQSRIERFITLADLPESWLPVSLLYYGAHTGRMSGTHKINLQNLTRGSALRKAVIAPPGYKVMAGDLSQIEARITACLAGQQDLINAFANDEDVYSLFASKLYGYAVNKNDHPDERFVGKTCILGLGYSMGWAKFFDTMKINPNVNMTEREAKRTVNVYRTTYSKIKALWKKMDMAIEYMATGRSLTIGPVRTDRNCIILPNGMKINYPGLERTLDDNWVYQSPNGPKKLYGGALTENIVQALARIVLGYAELRLSRRGVFAASQVHDELIYVVKDEHTAPIEKALHTALTAPVSWMRDLPVACEIASGESYYDAK